MALLRDLLEISGGTSLENKPVRTLFIHNTSIDTASNGGQACTWTVPDDVTWVGVEMWGGGGGGSGACCCCTAGWPSGSGAYARKLMTVTPGDAYVICAAGTTSEVTTNAGLTGFSSYMCKNGDTCMTAAGGPGGQACCCWLCGWAHPCNNPDPVTGFTGASFGICATRPMAAQSCQSACHTVQVVSGSPFGTPNMLFGMNGCCSCGGGCQMQGTLFPGGGAMSGRTYCQCGSNANRPGGRGAGGLVSLIYYSDTAP